MLSLESEEDGLLRYDFGTESDIEMNKYGQLRPWHFTASLLGEITACLRDAGVAICTKELLDENQMSVFGDFDWVEPSPESITAERKPLIVADKGGTLFLPCNRETLEEASYAAWLKKGDEYRVFRDRSSVLTKISQSHDLPYALTLVEQNCLVSVEPDFVMFYIVTTKGDKVMQNIVKAAVEVINKDWS